MQTTNTGPHLNAQLHLSNYLNVVDRIYDNYYFTNHGPLAKEFESKLESYLGLDNVVTIGNDSLALVMAMFGLNLSGKILVPSTGPLVIEQAVSWAKLECLTYEVGPESFQPSIESFTANTLADVEAVLLCESWGDRIDTSLLNQILQHRKKIIIYSHSSFGSEIEHELVSKDPNVITVINLSRENLLSTDQGGAIATNDNELAEIFRNIRSSYGARAQKTVNATANGRFSEFQAGIGIESLSMFDQAKSETSLLWNTYRDTLSNIPGIAVYEPRAGVDFFSSRIVLKIDQQQNGISRDTLVAKLRSHGIKSTKIGSSLLAFSSGNTKRQAPSPLCNQVLQIPLFENGSPLDARLVRNIILGVSE